MDELNPTHEAASYLAQFPVADLADPLLPASVRDVLEKSGHVAATSVQDDYGHYHLVMITAQQMDIARAANMTPQQYAAAKLKYSRR